MMQSRATLARSRPVDWHRWWQVALFVAACGLLPHPCLARFARFWEPVPLARLLTNVGRLLRQDPRNARTHYTLGRLHSLGFVQKAGETEVLFRDPTKPPQPDLSDFPPYESILQPRPAEAGQPDAAALRHLTASIRFYRRATQLAPREALYWLGQGWMLEQGAPFAADVDAPFLPRPRRAPAQAWNSAALAAYRRAYELDLAADLKKEHLGPGSDASISLEAGEGILRILKSRRLTAAEEAELARVGASVQTLQNKPRVVTPIVFPLTEPAPLSALLAPTRVVTFDLAGDGRGERWPWVGPNTGILVWDPERTGRIVSGRQLFGSATWSMFWRDGYAALAALDDDGDGWLAGRELAGLAVWCDANGNGVSDEGEVGSLEQIAVARIAVQPSGRHEGVPCSPHGIQRSNGTFLPTYDWTPVSRPERERAGP